MTQNIEQLIRTIINFHHIMNREFKPLDYKAADQTLTPWSNSLAV